MLHCLSGNRFAGVRTSRIETIERGGPHVILRRAACVRRIVETGTVSKNLRCTDRHKEHKAHEPSRVCERIIEFAVAFISNNGGYCQRSSFDHGGARAPNLRRIQAQTLQKRQRQSRQIEQKR